MQETRVRSLGQEEPLQEGIATHCSVLAWRIPWTEEPGGLRSIEDAESDKTEMTQHTGTGSWLWCVGASLQLWPTGLSGPKARGIFVP